MKKRKGKNRIILKQKENGEMKEEKKEAEG